jgi:hypothetical protein
MARKPRMTLNGHDLSIDLIADLPSNQDDGLCVYCAEDHKLYVYDAAAGS